MRLSESVIRIVCCGDQVLDAELEIQCLVIEAPETCLQSVECGYEDKDSGNRFSFVHCATQPRSRDAEAATKHKDTLPPYDNWDP